MKKIVIADISSFEINGKILGHWPYSAKMYKEILQDEFQVKIAGSQVYEQYFDRDFIKLPCGIDTTEKNSLISKIKHWKGEIANCRMVLKQDADVIIFQSSGFVPMLFCIMTTNEKKLKWKKILFIQYAYQCTSGIKQFLWDRAKCKISGLITSTDKVGQQYGIDYLSIPDYIYTSDKVVAEVPTTFSYDFCMVGTMNSSKDIEMVVDVFSEHPKYSLIIAGFFKDKERYKALISKKASNIEMRDCYLSNEEFDEIIKQSRFCLLPYKDTYNNTTSGVIYDYIFRMRPVIFRDMENFRFVTDHGAGIAYQKSVEEIFKNLTETDYGTYSRGLSKLIAENSEAKEKFKHYIREL